MTAKLLFVDDDQNVLNGMQRGLRKHFHVSTALGAADGLRCLQDDGPFAVIVADMQMPDMNGVQFLAQAKELAPDSVRLMLTGNADQATAIDAVNHGGVFRFLTKPCSADALVEALQSGIRQHHIITAERELMEGTVNGAVQVMTEILATLSTDAFGRAVVVRDIARRLASQMEDLHLWDLEMAAMLSRIGYVTIPEEILGKVLDGDSLSRDESQIVERVLQISAGLIRKIPRLENVARIVQYESKHFDGKGLPDDDVAGEDIPRESRLLKILFDLSDLEGKGLSKEQAFDRLTGKQGVYDSSLLEISRSFLLSEEGYSEIQPTIAIPFLQLRPGHRIHSNIEDNNAQLLLSAGHTLSETILEKLYNHNHLVRIREPICIYADTQAAPLADVSG